MIRSLLIANRGEIACRIMRTARRMGIRTVAVFSDADARALHVRQADEAVHIGPSSARESYLRGERIIEAAKATGAEAIHPGYGFLSENADFAQAVIDAGLIWVGPKPDSIRAMGLKDAAKKLMDDAGVPVTPGYLGEDQDPKRLKGEADAIGYPVLIKAVAGGGGKGMRRVDEPGAFMDALDSAKREAASSFGDDRVLIEKYILSPRHIEVQVFGDSHGNVVHLFERDCSLQRRHQKVIEEAPAPGIDQATRDAVCSAAVRAAKAVNYENAGTIEFIADASEGLRADRIWFMEMNTRLQVEHPVTEEITGQDLIEWQLRVASGEPLPKRQEELSINGHAIEARLYAEDPAKGFLPSVGRLEGLRLPEDVRIDTGFEEGDVVPAYYDPMLAKIICADDDRESARLRLAAAIEHLGVWPIATNAPFLLRTLVHDTFAAGEITTGFLSQHQDELTREIEPDEATLAGAAQMAVGACLATADRNPWNSALGFRLNAEPNRTVRVTLNGAEFEAQLPAGTLVEKAAGLGAVTLHGHTFKIGIPDPRGSVAGHGGADGVIIAPMPGKVTSVEVAEGERVTRGQRLLTLEAMKMEHGLVSPFDGVVAEVGAEAGAQVVEGAVLARVEPADEPATDRSS